MSSTFQLRLDTTAPVVTWGAVDGAAITETLTVQYVVSEPGIVSAELELADHRRIPMTVYSDHLAVVVPEDAPEGWGRIYAVVRDDVWNSATSELAVYISGVLAPQPPPPTGPPPAGGLPVAAFEAKDFGASTARGGDSFTVQVVVTSTSRVQTRSRYEPPPRQRRLYVGSARLGSNYTTVGRAGRSESAGALSSEATVIRRGEGPDTLAELIALDLL